MPETEPTRDFVESAEQFCTLIDHHQSSSDWEFLHKCASQLAHLYRAAVLLSLSPADNECDDIVGTEISHDQWEVLYHSLGEKLGSHCLYWEVYDPREDGDPVAGDLADDLADIYRDVKNGLVAYKDGQINEAVWDWRFTFSSHWGDHLVDALRAIHRIVSAHLLEGETE